MYVTTTHTHTHIYIAYSQRAVACGKTIGHQACLHQPPPSGALKLVEVSAAQQRPRSADGGAAWISPSMTFSLVQQQLTLTSSPFPLPHITLPPCCSTSYLCHTRRLPLLLSHCTVVCVSACLRVCACLSLSLVF